MNQFVINYLNQKFGYEIVKDTEIYDKIDLWKSYYKDEEEFQDDMKKQIIMGIELEEMKEELQQMQEEHSSDLDEQVGLGGK